LPRQSRSLRKLVKDVAAANGAAPPERPAASDAPTPALRVRLAGKVWAFGRLLANGELNSVLLFGSFLAYGVVDRIAVKKRGDNGPGPDAAVNVMGDVGAVVVGLGAYAAILLWLHPIAFGVAALPG